jgi:hypothetical protein
MKKNMNFWFIGVLLVMGFVVAGCSSVKMTTMYDASVPMEEQSIVVPDNGVTIVSIDGESVTGILRGEVYMPSGTHELVISANTYRSIDYQRWHLWTEPGKEFHFTRNFEAEHIYEINIHLAKEAARPLVFEGLTFYHEGDITAWIEIQDVTGSSEWDPIPLGAGSPNSGILTNWDRPVAFYFQTAGDAGFYTGYHNVNDIGDYYYTGEQKKPQFEPFHAGTAGVYFQLGLEAGYGKFGVVSLIELSGGLGFDGDRGFSAEYDTGLMEFLYYDRKIGFGFGAGLWNGPFPMVPYLRGMVSFFPATINTTHSLSFYYDYFPRDKVWGIGIKWVPVYIKGQPVTGNAATLR